jgi:hypothetical protein
VSCGRLRWRFSRRIRGSAPEDLAGGVVATSSGDPAPLVSNPAPLGMVGGA